MINASKKQHILIAGAGWAGCSAALTIAQKFEQLNQNWVRQQKIECTLDIYEISPLLGGRARSFILQSKNLAAAIDLDNGQHLLVGAYHCFWRQYRFLNHFLSKNQPEKINTSPKNKVNPFIKLNPQWQYFNHHKIFSEFFFGADLKKWRCNFKYIDLIYLVKALVFRKEKNLRLLNVKAWLYQEKISASLEENFLAPLCLATLNTPIQTASALRFHKVLQQLFLRNPKNAFLYLANQSLSELYPQKVRDFIEIVAMQSQNLEKKHRFACNYHLAQKLDIDHLISELNETTHTTLILATPLMITLDYLNALDGEKIFNLQYQKLLAQIKSPDFFQPITTIYFKLAGEKYMQKNSIVAEKFLTILNDPEKYGCAVEDAVFFAPPHLQKYSHQIQEKIISVVFSAKQHTQEEILECLQKHLQIVDIAVPADALKEMVIKIICEKRATFHATPEFCTWQQAFKNYAQAIIHQQQYKGLNIKIAGDYLHPYYPATLEAAVMSGRGAAKHIFD